MRREVLPSQISRDLRDAVLRAARDPRTSAADLARLALRAKEEGALETARALAARARAAKTGIGDVENDTAAPSPIPGVEPEHYAALAKVLEEEEEVPEEVTRRLGRLGAYKFSVRRLCDLGLCRNPRKVGKAWAADWPPGAREKFLADRAAQDEALAHSLGAYAAAIREDLPAALGEPFEGEAATLSGLLAVAHTAGTKGLESWLSDEAVRKKFPATTNLYRAANGIF